MTLRIKVLVILILICLGGGYLGYNWVNDNLRPQFLRIMEDGMVDHAFVLARIIESSLPDKGHQQAIRHLSFGKVLARSRNQQIRARIYEWVKRRLNFRVYVTDARGIVRMDSEHGNAVGQDYSRWNDVYLALRGKYGARSSREQNSRGKNVNAMYVGLPLYKKDAKGHKKVIGVLTLSKSKASLTGWAERAQAKLWQGVLLGALGLFLLAWFATQLALQPIFRLTQYARAITAGRRVPPPPISSDEIGTLTQSFIEMKESLWQRQDIESFVTQLTHELKSPISAIQGAAELLEDPEMPEKTRARFMQNIKEQTRRMNDIVQRLLTLVSLEQKEELDKKEDIELDPWLKDLRGRFTTQAHKKNITLLATRDDDTPTHLTGERFLLEQAIANLLQNSFNFTPKDGHITLHIDRSPEEQRLNIWVTDTGPGIPDYAIDRVLERFYSLEHPDTDSKGTGLGLPFVKQVALLHGGDFSIQNGPETGTIAHFWLPQTDAKRT